MRIAEQILLERSISLRTVASQLQNTMPTMLARAEEEN